MNPRKSKAPGSMWDRTVFAEYPNGGEIVRYDRSGKWYYESNGYHKGALLFVEDAVKGAIEAKDAGGHIFYNRAGGSSFYRLLTLRQTLIAEGNRLREQRRQHVAVHGPECLLTHDF